MGGLRRGLNLGHIFARFCKVVPRARHFVFRISLVQSWLDAVPPRRRSLSRSPASSLHSPVVSVHRARRGRQLAVEFQMSLTLGIRPLCPQLFPRAWRFPYMGPWSGLLLRTLRAGACMLLPTMAPPARLRASLWLRALLLWPLTRYLSCRRQTLRAGRRQGAP